MTGMTGDDRDRGMDERRIELRRSANSMRQLDASVMRERHRQLDVCDIHLMCAMLVMQLAVGGLISIIFETNDSILAGVMSKTNRDK